MIADSGMIMYGIDHVANEKVATTLQTCNIMWCGIWKFIYVIKNYMFFFFLFFFLNFSIF